MVDWICKLEKRSSTLHSRLQAAGLIPSAADWIDFSAIFWPHDHGSFQLVSQRNILTDFVLFIPGIFQPLNTNGPLKALLPSPRWCSSWCSVPLSLKIWSHPASTSGHLGPGAAGADGQRPPLRLQYGPWDNNPFQGLQRGRSRLDAAEYARGANWSPGVYIIPKNWVFYKSLFGGFSFL